MAQRTKHMYFSRVSGATDQLSVPISVREKRKQIQVLRARIRERRLKKLPCDGLLKRIKTVKLELKIWLDPR